MQRTNDLGQPIGEPLPNHRPAKPPTREVLVGQRCRLEPLRAEPHADALFEAYAKDVEGRNWTYLPYGPFESAADYRGFVESMQDQDDPVFYAVVSAETQLPVGVGSYLRIEPGPGVIEVGHLSYAPALQRTPASTEAMYLMMRHVFEDLGYRRYEWKCDSLNAPSRAAAERLGFRYEGTFRQAVVMKARNRDTAWFSILDREWGERRRAFEAWLDPENFDAQGRQRRSLESFVAR
jgi:RimJ/RimL family protein N-acetyltransferase